MVKIGGFVEELCIVFQREKSMGKAGRNPKLLFIIPAQFNAKPLTKCCRRLSDVDSYIKYGSLYDSN